MKTYLMRILGLTNISINIAAIVSVFLFPPCPFGVLAIAFPTMFLVAYIEWFKKKFLIEKKEILYMVVFGMLIVLSVFFLTLGLAVLVYL